MAETELTDLEELRPRRTRFEWVLPLFFRPGRTLKAVTAENNGVWITPLIVLSILAIVFVLAGAPLRTQAAQVVGEPPPDFQWWTPEQQEQYFASQANRASPVAIYVFPILGALAGVWIPWFLLGSILHLALTLSGSRGTNTAALNLAGWASLPFAIRYIVRAASLLIDGKLIQSPGLSGFIGADAAGFQSFLRIALVNVDLYLIWMTVLLLVGVVPLTGLTRGKTWFAVVVSVLILLALQAVPGLIAASLGGLSVNRPFFF